MSATTSPATSRAVLAPSALDPDQRALAEVAAAWLADRSPSAVVRDRLEAPLEDISLPGLWAEMVELGWIGLAVVEAAGGQGAGLAGLAVVLEEWGRACAPGPFPATALVATLVGAHAPELVGPILGGAPAAVSLHPGSSAAVDGAAEAAWLLVPDEAPAAEDLAGEAGDRCTRTWRLLPRTGFVATPVPGADPTRRLATVVLDVDARSAAPAFEVPAGRVERLATLAAAAEAVGVASWCVHVAADWACTREQFDRPIGQFQAVKHRCADALCRLELARAATWDAAQLDPDDPELPLAVAAAGSLATAAAFECAKDAIQVLGGIGYTWEHDAHLYLRRATFLHHRARPPAEWRRDVVAAARAGRHRHLRLELPPQAEGLRERIRVEVAGIAALDGPAREVALADGGWMQPHWPAPWGRDAGPLEQLVTDEELASAGVSRRHLQVAGWVLPTLIAHGTQAQQQRWIGPSLRGEIYWCQLFSEPGAGSDLAALSTRAERADGGWRLTGQKVWTTLAREAQWGLCLARSDLTAPKHEGITCFVVDMAAEGLEVRPLRELTGFSLFNEVFLDAVFVPDEQVVGQVHDGWRCARTTLGNERVAMASGSSFGPGVTALLQLAEQRGRLDDPHVVDRVGELLVDSQALAVLGMRNTLRAIGAPSSPMGAQPGPESSVRKLLGVEHEQAVQEAGMAVLGADAVVELDEGQRWFAGFLGNRALSIAGGTSEIQRNVIAERLLGLPRD
jgi:alkylation response protein AidB-like acyl-CoA dehydrogenase